ncbi:MAG TPA: hypothetical protein VFQ61_26340 [Polyangiaceae bacterium]|nr:hypothetical protein [Polyangiaceae bacterium]
MAFLRCELCGHNRAPALRAAGGEGRAPRGPREESVAATTSSTRAPRDIRGLFPIQDAIPEFANLANLRR